MGRLRKMVAGVAVAVAAAGTTAAIAPGAGAAGTPIPIGDYPAPITNVATNATVGSALLNVSAILQPHGAGLHVNVDAGTLPPGTYVVRLRGTSDMVHYRQTKACLMTVDTSGGQCFVVFRTNAVSFPHVSATITPLKTHTPAAIAVFS